MVKSNRLDSLADKLVIEDIKHFQEGSVFLNSRNMISLEMAFCLGVLLTPYLNIIFHISLCSYGLLS